MKKILLATVAVIAFGAPAFAADLGAAPRYTKAPAYAQPIYNWTGFYIGGHIGGAFGGDNSILGSSRFLGGVQGGADYQFAPNWVAGIEAQYSWTSSSSNTMLFPGGVLVNSNSDQLGSVTGRLGYTFGPTLLYAKGGYAWKDGDNLTATVAGVPVGFAAVGNHRDGYTVGAGAEYMFAPSWSAKLEYMYYNFGTTTIVTAPAAAVGSRFNDDEHVLKVGVNYRFNWANPMGARY
jgi:outer membrane immunogenic protein